MIPAWYTAGQVVRYVYTDGSFGPWVNSLIAVGIVLVGKIVLTANRVMP